MIWEPSESVIANGGVVFPMSKPTVPAAGAQAVTAAVVTKSRTANRVAVINRVLMEHHCRMNSSGMLADVANRL